MSATAIDDDLWSAVGDPTRRRMLDLLLDRGRRHGDDAERPAARDPTGGRQAPRRPRPGRVWSTARLAGRERRYEVDEAQLARAVAQLSSVGATWDARLNRIKRIAEAIQHSQDG